MVAAMVRCRLRAQQNACFLERLQSLQLLAPIQSASARTLSDAAGVECKPKTEAKHQETKVIARKNAAKSEKVKAAVKKERIQRNELKVATATTTVGGGAQMVTVEKKSEPPEKPGAWKWLIRKRVWDLFMLPLFRFPNFDGTRKAAEKLWRLPEYRSANCVYVSTDTPQRAVRMMLLKNMKKMLVSRLPKALFSLLDPMDMNEEQVKQASLQAEFRIEGKPIGLDDRLNVDLIVVGSVAVDPTTGARLGKGEGHAEFEYAMLRYLKAVDDSILVVTTVHDDQLVDDIPVHKLSAHDLPVDVICTPTQIIHTKTEIPKPTEILWDQIISEKLSHFAFLRDLKEKTERETGKRLKMGDFTTPPRIDRFHNGAAIFISEMNPSTTSQELRDHLKKLGVATQAEAEIFKTDSRKTVGRVLVPESWSLSDLNKYVGIINNTQLKGWCIKARSDRHSQMDKALVCEDLGKLAAKKIASMR